MKALPLIGLLLLGACSTQTEQVPLTVVPPEPDVYTFPVRFRGSILVCVELKNFQVHCRSLRDIREWMSEQQAE